MNGDADGFEKWQLENKAKWDSFISWFADNRLQVDPTHRFYRGQY
jgi:hypothetical protein